MSTKYRIVERQTKSGERSYHIQERGWFSWHEWYNSYPSLDSAQKDIDRTHSTDKVVKEITYD